eukprot:SAG31_NODE_611_length_13558_cov_224.959730_4_plen_111_part_00
MSCHDRAAGSAKRTCARTCATCGQRSTSTHLQQSLVQLQALLDCCLASNPLPPNTSTEPPCPHRPLAAHLAARARSSSVLRPERQWHARGGVGLGVCRRARAKSRHLFLK